MKLIQAAERESYVSVAAGAMAQDVYLYCASSDLATMVRAWFDRAALELGNDQQVLLTQTVARPSKLTTQLILLCGSLRYPELLSDSPLDFFLPSATRNSSSLTS